MEIKVFQLKEGEASSAVVPADESRLRREAYELVKSMEFEAETPAWYETDALDHWPAAKKETLLSFWNRTYAHQALLKKINPDVRSTSAIMIGRELYCRTEQGWKSASWEY